LVIDIKDKYTEHWPVLPAEAAGNSFASGQCKHNGATCCTKAKIKTKNISLALPST
jgi:hypothetical protein